MVIQTMKSIDVCLKSENCLVFNYLKMYQNIENDFHGIVNECL